MTSALFVSHTGELGGAELFLVDLVRSGSADWRGAFLSDGKAVTTLREAGRPPLVLAADGALLAIRRDSGPRAILAGAGGAIGVARELASHARGVEVLCANSQKALFVCALAARLARRPLVWILHDIITDPAFSTVNRRAAVTAANLFAHKVVVNSRATGEAFVASGGRRGLVARVHNGFDVAAHPAASASAGRALRAEFGFNSRPVVAIFGRLTPWKGQHVLLDALSRLPDVQGLIVGAPLFGQEAYEADLRAQVKRLGLATRVRFAGFRQDVAALMAGSDIIVHASTAEEPFGRVVVEAMLAARPLVASAGGAVAEILREAETGRIVPAGDVPALISTLAATLADPAAAAAMAARARNDAAARFSLGETRAAMAAVLREVAGR